MDVTTLIIETKAGYVTSIEQKDEDLTLVDSGGGSVSAGTYSCNIGNQSVEELFSYYGIDLSDPSTTGGTTVAVNHVEGNWFSENWTMLLINLLPLILLGLLFFWLFRQAQAGGSQGIYHNQIQHLLKTFMELKTVMNSTPAHYRHLLHAPQQLPVHTDCDGQ